MQHSLLIIALALTQLGCRVCGETIRTEVKSPDERYVATVFERNCGATTPYVTHVNLRESPEELRASSSGTVVDGEIYTVRGQPQLKLTWSSDSSISIETIGGEEILGRESIWKEVKVTYK